MATDKIAMEYDLVRNNNAESTAYGKWYAQPVVRGTLNLKGFAQHIHDHQGTYRTSTIKGCLEEMVECMTELISQGEGVKLDGLGTFYPTFESKGVAKPENFNLAEHLMGIHIRFLPEGSKGEELTSKKFKAKCTLKRRFPEPEKKEKPDVDPEP